jgi:hypothetical protein
VDELKETYGKLNFLPASAGLLPRSLFDLEDRGNMFLRNVGLSPNCTASQPKDTALHSHRCENLKSNASKDVFCNVEP